MLLLLYVQFYDQGGYKWLVWDHEIRVPTIQTNSFQILSDPLSAFSRNALYGKARSVEYLLGYKHHPFITETSAATRIYSILTQASVDDAGFHRFIQTHIARLRNMSANKTYNEFIWVIN